MFEVAGVKWRAVDVLTVATALAAVLTAGLAARTANATTMRYASLEALYEVSDVVVRGVVVDHHTFRTDTQMFTDWTVEVQEVLAGQAPAAITVRQIGGELDGLVMHIPGDAVLAEGDHVVLFLQGAGDVLGLTALGQAALSVELMDPVSPADLTDAITSSGASDGAAAHNLPTGRVTRDLRGMTFYGPTEDGPGLFNIDEVEVTTLDHLRELASMAEGASR